MALAYDVHLRILRPMDQQSSLLSWRVVFMHRIVNADSETAPSVDGPDRCGNSRSDSEMGR